MAPPSTFNPSAATHLALLSDWMDGRLSLFEIADRYHTTIADLCFFFARPEITTQLSLLHAATYNRARLTATTHLDSAIAAMALIVRKFLQEQANPDPTLTPDQQRRNEDLGRRAATVLLRFIKNKPAPLTCSSPPTSLASAGEVLERSKGGEVPSARQATEEVSSPPPAPPRPQVSTTDLAEAALEALATLRPDLCTASPDPSPPPAPASTSQSEAPIPNSEHPTSTSIHDFLNSHFPSDHPTSTIPHPTSANEHWP